VIATIIMYMREYFSSFRSNLHLYVYINLGLYYPHDMFKNETAY